MRRRHVRTWLAVIAVLGFGLAAPATAQEEGEEFDPRQAIKEIQEDLEDLVEDFARLSGGDAAKGERVVDNIDKMIEDMISSQGRVLSNIDEILKQMKLSSSKNPQNNDQQQGKKPPKDQQNQQQQHRDRNQRPQDRERKPGQKPQQPQGQKPEGGEDERKPQQGKGKRRPPRSPEEKVPFIDDAERWGMLPPEVRQLLIENNFRDYFPDYEREIADYLKSLNRRR